MASCRLYFPHGIPTQAGVNFTCDATKHPLQLNYVSKGWGRAHGVAAGRKALPWHLAWVSAGGWMGLTFTDPSACSPGS